MTSSHQDNYILSTVYDTVLQEKPNWIPLLLFISPSEKDNN